MSTASEPGPRRLSRVRTLTVPAQERFETTMCKYVEKLDCIRKEIDSCIRHIDHARHDKPLLGTYSNMLDTHSMAYESTSKEFIKYLQSTRTPQGDSEEESHKFTSRLVYDQIEAAKNRLDAYLDMDANYSVHSHASKHSTKCSSRSSLLLRKQAKLEASRAKLKFLEEETLIMKQKAALEAKLKLRKAECEMEMYRKEISVMMENPPPNIDKDIQVPTQSSYERAAEYAYSVSQRNDIALEGQVNSNACDAPEADPPLNPLEEPFVMDTAQTKVPVTIPNHDTMTDLAKFLIKKDLILSRLTKFDDNPMLYSAWKLSFKGIMTELTTSFTEELDLLIRWLGPDSSKQAATIRACNAGNPCIAVKKIWERLEQRFGSPEMVESSLKQRVSSFPTLSSNDSKHLYDLADLAAEIDSIKSQVQYSTVFAHYDSSVGVNSLVSKLPWNLRDKWILEASKYKNRNNVTFPPFSVFVKFIQDLAQMKNDPSFQFDRINKPATRPALNKNFNPNLTVLAKKTDTAVDSKVSESVPLCPLHKTGHLLNDCKSFRKKSLVDKKKFILSNGICFKCCGPKRHHAKNCTTDVKCDICKNSSHPTALHVDVRDYEGEKKSETVTNSCTKVCGRPGGTSKSCAKILPVRVYHQNTPENFRIVYALIDDQSNQSLATTPFFDAFKESGPDMEYVLVSCSGRSTSTGRRGSGYVIENLDKTCSLQLPSLVECNDIPSNRDEIPSLEVALRYPHLQDIAPAIPPLIDEAAIELLLGRDITNVHFVQDQRIGGNGLPFAQKLPLGWVIIGQVCLGRVHAPEVSVSKTFVLNNGRPSSFEPCTSEFKLSVESNVFVKSEHDERIGLSIEDREFLKTMDSGFVKDEDGHWVAPLPFRKNRAMLPDNKPQAAKRAKSLDLSLRRNPTKREHVQQFMEKIFDKGHAEKAPTLPPDIERWYLPMFGVYHPKKPGSIRMVFDSSASYEGTSLNDVLMKGPDLSNSLQGILLRFRLEAIAVTADVEQMFHNFRVMEDHRNFLRFLWHPANNLDNPLEEFRMTVHVFGNCPSPAVATYGLRKSTQNADLDVQAFVSQNFYVDDGLVSCSSVEQAVDLMKRTQQALSEGGRLRLHKIASNSKEVLERFDKEDLAKDLKNLEIGQDNLPVQRSLGLSWDMGFDTFIFSVAPDSKPFTRRGVLSTINSLFDPIGFTAPVTLEGKLFLRDIMSSSSKLDWDEPLQEDFRVVWEDWVNSLMHLQKLSIPRMYCSLSVEKASRKTPRRTPSQLLVF